jgi:hypothetical protein
MLIGEKERAEAEALADRADQMLEDWWRVECGDHLNLCEALADTLRALLAVVK